MDELAADELGSVGVQEDDGGVLIELDEGRPRS